MILIERPEPFLAATDGEVVVSFEFFPPKSEVEFKHVLDRLSALSPRFVSVTYGAGGSTQARTLATVAQIARESDVPVAGHLTCVGASREAVDAVARSYWDAGVRHIVALRGDAGEAGAPFIPHPQGYAGAAELVAGLKRIAPFEISVAAYPEGHPDSPNRAADLDNLWRKIDAGADRAITQFFFSADCFLRFRDQAAALGLNAEIVPGILPIANVAQTRAFAARCGARIPEGIDRLLDGLDEQPAARQLIAATIAADLCARLHAGGVRQFHFFTLNRAEISQAVCHLLGLRTGDRCHEQSCAA